MSVQEKDPHKKLKILAVDDEETVLKLYSSLLKEDKHAITLAETGHTALAEMDKEQFDVVFLDLKLPDIEGTDLLKKIREKNEWVPVIIVTANPSLESSIEAIRSGGVHEYIIKPFNKTDLKMGIRRVIEKSELTIQNRRLLRKLETTNKALTERVDELEKFARDAVDYEKILANLRKKVSQLEKKTK